MQAGEPAGRRRRVLQGTTVSRIALLLPVQLWEAGCLSVGRGDGAYAVPWCSGERATLPLPSVFALVISDLSVSTSGVTLLVYHPAIHKLGAVIIPRRVARRLLTTVEEESRSPGCQCCISAGR